MDAGHPSVAEVVHAEVEDMADCMVAAQLDHKAVVHKVVVVGLVVGLAADHILEAHSSGGNSVALEELEGAAAGYGAGHVQEAIVEG